MTKDELNEIAWRDFMMYCWTQPEAHAAFRGATGRPQRSKTNSPLDLLIDKAVGGAEDDKYMEEFLAWATKEHCGENYAPKKWHKLRADGQTASDQTNKKAGPIARPG